MQFKKTVLHYFAFLKDYGFKMRGYFIKDELGAESFVFRKKWIKLYIDFYPFTSADVQNNSNNAISWKVFVNLEHQGKEVNILNSKIFSKEVVAQIRDKIDNVNQAEIEKILIVYSDFIRENINSIYNLDGSGDDLYSFDVVWRCRFGKYCYYYKTTRKNVCFWTHYDIYFSFGSTFIQHTFHFKQTVFGDIT